MYRTPKAGEFYRHFKNKLYQIVTIARHSETGEPLVIYQALYGDFGTYARPLSMFTSEVDHEKYPEVTQKYRFEKVELVHEKMQSESAVTTAVTEPTEPNLYLMNFLEAETFDRQMIALKQMEGHVGQSELDSIYVVLDMKPVDGEAENQIHAIRRYLQMQDHFDGNRLR